MNMKYIHLRDIWIEFICAMSDRVSFRKCLFHKIDDTIFCSERTIKIKLNSLLTHSLHPDPNIFKLTLCSIDVHEIRYINFVVKRCTSISISQTLTHQFYRSHPILLQMLLCILKTALGKNDI